MELHTSPLRGHSGFLKTYHKVKKGFFWDGLKLDIQKFVAEYFVCQQMLKQLRHWVYYNLYPFQANVGRRFQGLPKSDGKSVIMVVVDRLTKYAHFCALSHPFKACTIYTTFMETIQKLHGNPDYCK